MAHISAGVTTQITYTSEKRMAKGTRNVCGKGWEVVSISSYTPRKGILRTLAGGFLFFGRKPRFVVTYRREGSAEPTPAFHG